MYYVAYVLQGCHRVVPAQPMVHRDTANGVERACAFRGAEQQLVTSHRVLFATATQKGHSENWLQQFSTCYYQEFFPSCSYYWLITGRVLTVRSSMNCLSVTLVETELCNA
jgi:hypothetical protein